jgi:hypothetical protein
MRQKTTWGVRCLHSETEVQWIAYTIRFIQSLTYSQCLTFEFAEPRLTDSHDFSNILYDSICALRTTC